MLTNQRYEKIMDHLNENGMASVNELVDITSSSAPTIRRDLTHLEEKGLIERVHGGAAISHIEHEEDYRDKAVKNLSKKIKIAQTAASLIEDGDIIFIDAGTTTYEMLPFISQEDLTIVTNSITLIEQLVRNGHRTHVLGGRVKPSTKAVVGPEVIDVISRLSFDKCFIGVNAIDTAHGLSTPEEEEAYIKSRAIRQSRNAYALVDSTKFNRSAFIQFADIEDAFIITDDVKHSFIEKIKSRTEIYGGEKK
ncbi:DeoR/GlpR transcriptional regulator [Salinicoccus sp. ID82-1]|uniref:DeoR/GlpR transcriptional regulator n=1 Tax=Salinicoccus cyprini TaxID=2493691 RepID=A0A558AYN4_9STAP|nr:MULTISPECIES: DeoR/GlpR family DNA-binding transcription regulator [Salinicoccus]MCG1008919.1 DeoR/GlpR transcriptional regulator [Salinicoccus sp. ID82-1]TVT29379.1 DeoR/GlpR transcriptional regulator [Salinicoccus cyprini]